MAFAEPIIDRTYVQYGAVFGAVILVGLIVLIGLGHARHPATPIAPTPSLARYQMAAMHTLVAYDIYVMDTATGTIWILRDGAWRTLPTLPQQDKP